MKRDLPGETDTIKGEKRKVVFALDKESGAVMLGGNNGSDDGGGEYRKRREHSL